MTTTIAAHKPADSPAAGFTLLELAYLKMRRHVGVIALLLPVVLIVIGGPHRTISSYYHSNMRDVFVGAVCAIALFLYFDDVPSACDPSKSLVRWYDWTGNVAAWAALGVAFIPTIRDGEEPNWQSAIHVACSILLFVCMAISSLYLYRQDRTGGEQQNLVHLVCGTIIAVLVVAAVIGTILRMNIFWYETFAIQAFAVSFIVKGSSWRNPPLTNCGLPESDVADIAAVVAEPCNHRNCVAGLVRSMVRRLTPGPTPRCATAPVTQRSCGALREAP